MSMPKLVLDVTADNIFVAGKGLKFMFAIFVVCLFVIFMLFVIYCFFWPGKSS